MGPADRTSQAHDGDRRLGKSEEQVIEPVFREEEMLRVLGVATAAPPEHHDVAARAKPAAFGM